MIGSIIGGALGAVGSIFGAIKGGKAMRKAKRMTEADLRENQAWFDRRYNEDATQRADSQRLLALTSEQIRDRNRNAIGRAAVVGGTDEGVRAVAEANARQMGDVVSNIYAQNEANKANIEAQYQNRRDSLRDRLKGIEAQRSQNIANATTNLLQTAGSIGTAIDGYAEHKADRENQWKIMSALKGI